MHARGYLAPLEYQETMVQMERRYMERLSQNCHTYFTNPLSLFSPSPFLQGDPGVLGFSGPPGPNVSELTCQL